MVYNTPIFWIFFFFLVTRAYGLKWPSSLIQNGGQMTTDQNIPPTFFWSPDDIFTRFKVKPNPLTHAQSNYTSSSSTEECYLLNDLGFILLESLGSNISTFVTFSSPIWKAQPSVEVSLGSVGLWYWVVSFGFMIFVNGWVVGGVKSIGFPFVIMNIFLLYTLLPLFPCYSCWVPDGIKHAHILKIFWWPGVMP